MTQVLGVKPVVWVHGNTHYEFSTPTASGNNKHSHSYVISGEEQYTYWSWASVGKATPYLYCHGTGPEGLLEGSEPAQALTMKQVTLVPLAMISSLHARVSSGWTENIILSQDAICFVQHPMKSTCHLLQNAFILPVTDAGNELLHIGRPR